MGISGVGASGTGIGALDKVDRETMGARVYRDLRNLIMAGQVSPGDRLTIRTLAAALGTSMMPVRDAITRLAAEQALEVLPNRTVRVPIMTRARFEEVRTIRLMLEGHAVETAAAIVTDEALARIGALHEEFTAEHNTGDPDPAALIRINKDFHFRIYEAAAMPALLQIIEGLWLQIGPVLNFDLRSKSKRLSERVALHHHGDLLDALGRRDGPAARAALAGDIVSAGDFILRCGSLV
ncbi:GntR family transcriptional regulator [Azospirillum canadense]|uniref:GntR family transcriptional regulator n=1 Tax=Azospirillum canadense TaxID=403962 RepID=UPI0022272BE7|nr:GntR family transcriptional regulator [Azospirillum canadense]MCW2241121.1 DNA-binding GntR family transcriptional regulator [Azospirillum canadense]